MKSTPSNRRRPSADFQSWMHENAADNSLQLTRIKRCLRQALEQDLTPRQKQMLTMHFQQNLSFSEIARTLQVHPSTVSRTVHRAQQRLYRTLRYSFINMPEPPQK